MSNIQNPATCCAKCENRGPTVAMNYNVDKKLCSCLTSVDRPLNIKEQDSSEFFHQECSETGQTTGGTTGGTSGGTGGTTTGWSDWFGPGRITNLAM